MKALMRLRQYLRDRFTKEPHLLLIPSYEGKHMGLGFLVQTHLGENKELPRKGDLIIELEADGMGATVRTDHRHRVMEIKPAVVHNTDRPYFWAVTRRMDGKKDCILTVDLRRMIDYPRVWIVVT